MILRFDKCHFLERKVTFLGHILENGTVRPSLEKTAAIRNFPTLRNVKQVMSFLGLAGFFFRKFVPSFAQIAKPLSDLTRKDVPFVFGDVQNRSFEALNEALCTEPVLKIYNQVLETELHTDASIEGFWGVSVAKARRCVAPRAISES